jgi:hypothetical protein
MKNVTKPMVWDIKNKNKNKNKNKQAIKNFIIEYKTFCELLGFIGDGMTVRNFGFFVHKLFKLTIK